MECACNCIIYTFFTYKYKQCLLLIGLSFYTSEKTLRAAFEGFGELVEGISTQRASFGS